LKNFYFQLGFSGRVRLNFAEQDVPEQEVAFGGIGMSRKKLANSAVRFIHPSLPQQ
jgi:hypothetical protein